MPERFQAFSEDRREGIIYTTSTLPEPDTPEFKFRLRIAKSLTCLSFPVLLEQPHTEVSRPL